MNKSCSAPCARAGVVHQYDGGELGPCTLTPLLPVRLSEQPHFFALKLKALGRIHTDSPHLGRGINENLPKQREENNGLKILEAHHKKAHAKRSKE